MLVPKIWASTFGIYNMSTIDIVMHRRLASSIGGFGILINRLLILIDDSNNNNNDESSSSSIASALAMAVTPALLNLFAMTFIWDDSKQVMLRTEWTMLWMIMLGALVVSAGHW